MLKWIELANNLRKGVPMATPVFDGATREEEISKQCLRNGGLCLFTGQIHSCMTAVRVISSTVR